MATGLSTKSMSISIHALLAESDQICTLVCDRLGKFLSTLSLRRATFDDGIALIPHQHFYPRSPCGERPLTATAAEIDSVISIHALLAESDPGLLTPRMDRRYFYPRSPCGERLFAEKYFIRIPFISIHALLAESDADIASFAGLCKTFLSTLSLRRATFSSDLKGNFITFLSTLSLRRATRLSRVSAVCRWYFYPRSPCGERRKLPVWLLFKMAISIHALLAESDRWWRIF